MKTNFLFLSLLTLSLVACSDDEGTVVVPTPQTEVVVVTSSNTSGKVTISRPLSSSATVKTLQIPSTDTDGVYYSLSDEILVASRTNNKLEVYGGIQNAADMASLTMAYASTSDFNNARETAVSGDKVVVAQDQNLANGNTNKLVVYQKTASGLVLQNSYTVDFKTWGIFIDGTTLYAVADLTGDLVVFNNFFSNPTGAITPNKRVTIEGLVRSHGIVYSPSDNKMILTDVGLAASDSDGGLIVINNFSTVLNATANLGTIPMTSQVRVYGPNSTLGNPVDVAYDSMTGKIFIAERLNAGGRLLTFNLPTTSGDALPAAARVEAGISSVYADRR